MMRRYDIDWIRIGAIGLLILYHAVISFQSWAEEIFFIKNEQELEILWILMSMFNVWRIPILFMVSGMGVYFAMQNRNWKQLLKDRVLRILLPFLFGCFFICPIFIAIFLAYYKQEIAYIPNSGHLWFLGNIFAYVIFFLPLFIYFQKRPNHIFFRFLSSCFKNPTAKKPIGLLLFGLPLTTEAILLNPEYFSAYSQTVHGFCLGMVCFFMGFIIVSLKDSFWQTAEFFKHISLAIAVLFFSIRLFVFELEIEINGLIALESSLWMIAVFGYCKKFFNQASTQLSFWSEVVYPIYILHMPIQYFFSYYLFPLTLHASLKLLLLLLATLLTSLVICELFIKPFRWIRPFFGLSFQKK